MLLEKAYGFQDDNERTPNGIETKYGLASIGKMFTAISIMQLIEKNEISLNQLIGEILPNYPNKDVREKVTIKNLLNHTSGLGDFFTKKYFEQPEGSIKKLKDYLPFFVNDSLAFEPGERFSYSNGGYIVLGLIIEKVSNEKYQDYVEKKYFETIRYECYKQLIKFSWWWKFNCIRLA
ncbi:serine hydrolase domain-containing protein [Zobellia nedashkovskayae]